MSCARAGPAALRGLGVGVSELLRCAAGLRFRWGGRGGGLHGHAGYEGFEKVVHRGGFT